MRRPGNEKPWEYCTVPQRTRLQRRSNLQVAVCLRDLQKLKNRFIYAYGSRGQRPDCTYSRVSLIWAWYGPRYVSVQEALHRFPNTIVLPTPTPPPPAPRSYGTCRKIHTPCLARLSAHPQALPRPFSPHLLHIQHSVLPQGLCTKNSLCLNACSSKPLQGCLSLQACADYVT